MMFRLHIMDREVISNYYNNTVGVFNNVSHTHKIYIGMYLMHIDTSNKRTNAGEYETHLWIKTIQYMKRIK